MNTIKLNKKNTLMVAHRGLSGLEKENTMAAFIAAGNRSYYGIECDIHPTSDNRFVVCHDSNINRVSGIDMVIENNKFEDVTSIKLIDDFDNVCKPHLLIPEFIDYLRCCKKYNKVCIIELKDMFSNEDIHKVLDIIEEEQYTDNVIIISFVKENTVRVRTYNNSVKVQQLLTEFSKDVCLLCQQFHVDIDIHYKAITKEDVDFAHSLGIKVNVWTVNTLEDGIRMVEAGVDYITTNILE